MTKPRKQEPTRDQLQSMYYYENGFLHWRDFASPRATAGSVAGYVHINKKERRRRVVVKNWGQAHHSRLVYIWHRGDIPNDLVIDHIDGDTLNDNIENLRAITVRHNQYNRHDDIKGCYFNKKASKWQAGIKVCGSHIHLGMFEKESDARAAYLAAKAKHHKIEAHQ